MTELTSREQLISLQIYPKLSYFNFSTLSLFSHITHMFPLKTSKRQTKKGSHIENIEIPWSVKYYYIAQNGVVAFIAVL